MKNRKNFIPLQAVNHYQNWKQHRQDKNTVAVVSSVRKMGHLLGRSEAEREKGGQQQQGGEKSAF